MPARGRERSTIFVGAMSRSKQLRGFQTSSASGFRQLRRYASPARAKPRMYFATRHHRGVDSNEHFIADTVLALFVRTGSPPPHRRGTPDMPAKPI